VGDWLWEVSWGLVLLGLVLKRFDLRKPHVLIGLGMHGTIWALMQLKPFSLVTISFYVLLWSHEEWAGLLTRRA
jgi:hypothetical protein